MKNILQILDDIKDIMHFKTEGEVALCLKMTKGNLSSHKVRSAIPYEALSIFCETEGISLDWLLFGKGRKYKEEQKDVIVPQPDDYIYIPLYNIRAAAGHGAINETEEVADVMAFKASWVRSSLGASRNDLFLIYVDGDSMEPTLKRGDIILIDKRDAPATHDGIYVFITDGALLIKRLQRLPGGIINIVSDNPAYKPFEVKQEQLTSEIDKITIIGRVVWAGRRF